VSTIEMKPPTDRKKKRVDTEKVVELVYRTAGFLPKGCGSVYRLERKRDRSQARSPHDCLAIAIASREYNDTLECPACSRLIDAGRAAKLIGAKI